MLYFITRHYSLNIFEHVFDGKLVSQNLATILNYGTLHLVYYPHSLLY